jgi:hypothetical protein
MERSLLSAAVAVLAVAAGALSMSPASAEAGRHARVVVLKPTETRRATVVFRIEPWMRRAGRVTAVRGRVRRPIRRARFLRAVRLGRLTLYPHRGLSLGRHRRPWVVSIRVSRRRPSGRVDPRTLMSEPFRANGSNNLITNEYAGWHASDSTVVRSPVWRSDGGSLFSVGATDASGAASRVASTGRVDSSFADKYSQTYTHSNKMRFWTKQGGFGNVRIDADIKPSAWGAGAPTSWAGFKFYLRRQLDATESGFYTIEPYILDGHIYIQKKCLGNTGGGNYSAGGTYYLLASKSGYSVPLDSWQKIGASAKTNSDGTVTISLYRNGTLALQATDRGIRSDGTGCPTLGAGHLGFRSDYLQYYLDNWKVTTLP